MSFAFAFAISLLLAYWFSGRTWKTFMDAANERSLHTGIVPRSGGVAIWVGVVIGLVIYNHNSIDTVLFISFAILFAVAILDDILTLKPLLRLGVHILVSWLIVLEAGISWRFGIPFLPDMAWVAFNIVLVVWCINFYNFMDGMDGFAAGMAIMGFGTLSAIGYLQADQPFFVMNGLVACSVAGFLVWNFPPARIFMGDSGSTLLGLAMAVCSQQGWQRGLYPFWVPLVIFSPFWVDASVTLAKRLFNREPVWQAHRKHYYQRLALAGLGHKSTVMLEYSLMVACSASVLIWLFVGEEYNQAVAWFWVMAYLVLLPLAERHIRTRLGGTKQNDQAGTGAIK